MALVGYARVSSVGQSLDVQLDKLRHCDKVFQEKKSGTSDKRPQLQACLEYVREGDVMMVFKRPKSEMRQRRKQGTLIKTLMKDYDLSKASVYRLLNKTDNT